MPHDAAEFDNHPITISALDEHAADRASIVAMFVLASTDSAICAATFLPPAMTTDQARAYCAAHQGFVIREAGVPAGVFLIHRVPRPGDGVQLPAGCVELEFWILPRFRERALLRRAWPQLLSALATRYDDVVATCWEDNHAAQKFLRACGFQFLGRSFWSDGSDSGWCAVYVYDLRNLPTSLTTSAATSL